MAKILVIDDSRFQRKLISSVLEEKGYQVLTAGDGREGFAVARQESPDLVICDLLMPGIDGFNFLRMVREEGLATPVLVFTSDIQKTTRDICLELGACDVLNKPVKGEALIPAVERAIGSAKKS
ncbi:MAG: response regulator [Methanolinea sp.]|nr:response regulator [Methanolinea sp.]